LGYPDGDEGEEGTNEEEDDLDSPIGGVTPFDADEIR